MVFDVLAWLGTTSADEVSSSGRAELLMTGGAPGAPVMKAGPPALATAKLTAEIPLKRPKLCMAAAWMIGGLDAIRIFSISASCNLLDLALLFWNHILTWVSVRLRLLENSARSAIDKYCFSRNFFSSAMSCWVVNGVRGFLFGLCFLRVHRSGPNEGEGGGPEIELNQF